MPRVCAMTSHQYRRWSKRTHKKNSVRSSPFVKKSNEDKKALSIRTVHIHIGVGFLQSYFCSCSCFLLPHSHARTNTKLSHMIFGHTQTAQHIMQMPPSPHTHTKNSLFSMDSLLVLLAVAATFFSFGRSSTKQSYELQFKIQKCRK